MNSVTVYGQPKYLVLLDTDITTAADGLTPLQVGTICYLPYLNGSKIFLFLDWL